MRGPIISENRERKVAHILEEQLMDVNVDHQNEDPNVIELPLVAEKELRPENGLLENHD